jgi:AcrR family transcriptional regulator
VPRGQFDRSERKARTRRLLLDAAARVYAREGFAGATLDEVASEAGFTKGALYSHFGNKENLLAALVEEYLLGQVAEQMALFDRELLTWERPLAGSQRWMDRLQQNPDRFRLFIELWARAQRDEHLRRRLARGLGALRTTFARFAADSAIDAGVRAPAGAEVQMANVMLGLGLGLSLLKLTDPCAVPGPLLGQTLSVMIRAMQSSAQAREQFATRTDR